MNYCVWILIYVMLNVLTIIFFLVILRPNLFISKEIPSCVIYLFCQSTRNKKRDIMDLCLSCNQSPNVQIYTSIEGLPSVRKLLYMNMVGWFSETNINVLLRSQLVLRYEWVLHGSLSFISSIFYLSLYLSLSHSLLLIITLLHPFPIKLVLNMYLKETLRWFYIK